MYDPWNDYYTYGGMMTIPVMNYTGVYKVKRVGKDYMLDYYSNKFSTANKLYGEHKVYKEFLLTRFRELEYKSGVMLIGKPGSGKTELGKQLANALIDEGMTVVMVTEISATAELINFLDNLDNVVIFLDEFGKTFSNSDMNKKMLNLFNNNSGKKRIFIITENNSYHISTYILNRPGRVRYRIEFSNVSPEVIQEFCDEKGLPQNIIDRIKEMSRKARVFTFDHLSSLVDEILKGGELTFIVKLLNIDAKFIKEKIVLDKITVRGDEVKIISFRIIPDDFYYEGEYSLEAIIEWNNKQYRLRSDFSPAHSSLVSLLDNGELIARPLIVNSAGFNSNPAAMNNDIENVFPVNSTTMNNDIESDLLTPSDVEIYMKVVEEETEEINKI